jgi:hypothetical protein
MKSDIAVVASSCFLVSTLFCRHIAFLEVPFHGFLDIALPFSLLSTFHPLFWFSRIFLLVSIFYGGTL